MRDEAARFDAAEVDIVGISPDPPARQAAFDRRNELGFALLSDPDGSVAEAWGVRRGSLLGALVPIVRSAFLVDREGRIERAWYGISASGTAETVLEAVEAGGGA